MSEQPLVSVVIPVYNGANYLQQGIDSALGQTYPRVEVLVINDGSRDRGQTESIARSYGSRVRYFAKENGGVASALNFGARQMQGEYFSWLSHDDVYLPHKVSAQVQALGNRAAGARPAILYSDYEEIDGTGRLLGTIRIGNIPSHRLRYELIHSFPVHGCTTLLPRECLAITGGFEESRRYTQDYHFWFRLAQQFEFHHLPEVLIQSRRHPEQGCLQPASIAEVEDLYLWMLDHLQPDEVAADGQLAADAYLDLAIALRTKKLVPSSAAAALARCLEAIRREPLASRMRLWTRVAVAQVSSPLRVGARVAASFLWRLRISRARPAPQGLAAFTTPTAGE